MRNAANRKNVALMSIATPLDYATLTKTVHLQLQNTEIIISAHKVSKIHKKIHAYSTLKRITLHTNALVYCCQTPNLDQDFKSRR